MVSAVPLGNGKHFHIIKRSDDLCIVKARLFCRYLKGSSLRIVYAYFEDEQRIEFIELYCKGEKEDEDRGRIDEYMDECLCSFLYKRESSLTASCVGRFRTHHFIVVLFMFRFGKYLLKGSLEEFMIYLFTISNIDRV